MSMSKEHSSTFIGTGNSLIVNGTQCYAYSGPVNSGGSSSLPVTKMLTFHTPDKTIKVKINVTNDVTSTTSDVSYKITFNGITIMKQILRDEISEFGGVVNNLELVIPPNTLVECYADTAADPHKFSWMVAGRVYG